MLWLFSIIAFMSLGGAAYFCKRGNAENSHPYSPLETIICLGAGMGALSIGILLFSNTEYHFINFLIYLPVSLIYVFSDIILIYSIKYLKLSVAVPVLSSSDAFSCFLILLILHKLSSLWLIIPIILTCVGILGMGYQEYRQHIDYFKIHQQKKGMGFCVFLLPLIYCQLDAISIMLDCCFIENIDTSPLKHVTAENICDTAMISNLLTFGIVAVGLYIYLRYVRKYKLILSHQPPRCIAAVFEIIGFIAYTYSIRENAVLATPIMGSSCLISVILGRFLCKERYNKWQWISFLLILLSTILLGLGTSGVFASKSLSQG